MEYKNLILAYGLILLMLGLSFANTLKLEKDIVFSSIRATVQLIIMGFLLEMIFKIQQPVYFLFILIAMTGVAAMISGKRGEAIPSSRVIVVGIAIGSLLTFSLLYVAGVVKPEAHYVIPIGGMIIGNAMNASSLAMNRLIGEMGHQRKQIETLLSLGASARQASECRPPGLAFGNDPDTGHHEDRGTGAYSRDHDGIFDRRRVATGCREISTGGGVHDCRRGRHFLCCGGTHGRA